MNSNSSEENESFSLTKFESMLKTNNIFFFDSIEFEKIIHHYLEIGKIPLAKKAIKLGLDQHPSSINLKLFYVEILIFENKLSQAEKLLNNLFRLEPNNEELFIQKANIYSKRDNHIEAIRIFGEALKLSEESSELHSLIGMEYLFLDNYTKAKFHFMKCIELDLEDYSSLYNIIYCFDFLGENKEAIQYLTWYLDQNPYCEVAWHQLGKLYVDNSELEKALTAYEFAIISDDTFIGAYLEKAKVLEKLGRFTESIEQYKISIAIEGASAITFLKIGCCYDKLNKNDKALKYFFKSVKEDPAFDKAWIEISKFYFRKKDNLKALFYVNKAINIDEHNPQFWLYYSRINKSLNYYNEANKGLKRAIEFGDNSAETFIEIADILIHLKQYETAKLNLIKALKIYPENEEIEYRICGVFFKLNNSQKGFLHLLKALHKNYENIFILEELFPEVYNNKKIINFINNYKNSSK